MHVIAGKAVCFGEALRPEFKAYAAQVIANAQTLAEELTRAGFRLVSGGTDNHLILIDMTSKGLTGKIAEAALGRAGITVNKNLIPFDTRKPMDPSGIRMGTPALTTRGLREDAIRQVAAWIVTVLSEPDDAALAERDPERDPRVRPRLPRPGRRDAGAGLIPISDDAARLLRRVGNAHSALSGPPARPVARTPLLVSHGSNPDRSLQLDVVDRVGEPAKPEFPRPLFVDGSVDSGPLADASEGILKVFAKLAAEPCPLSLVVSDGLSNLRFRLRVDRQRLHGYRSRNSARNASASRPRAVPDRISATRLEASESQAASTSSSSGSREQRRKCTNSARSLGGNCTSFAFQSSSTELIDSNPGDQG